MKEKVALSRFFCLLAGCPGFLFVIGKRDPTFCNVSAYNISYCDD